MRETGRIAIEGGGIQGRNIIPCRGGWGEIIIFVAETETSCDILEGQAHPCIWIHIMCI